MRLLLVLLLVAVVEVAVLVAVGDAIGVLPTLAVLLLASLLGLWLLRREGTRAFAALAAAVGARRVPDREVSDGMLIAIGGVLILLPGLVSDLLGLLVLLPPTRALLRRRLASSARRRAGALYGPAFGSGFGPRRGPVVEGAVLDGEVVDEVVEPDRPGPAARPSRDAERVPTPNLVEGFTVTHRRYVSHSDAHYGGALAAGAYCLGLFGDVVTELAIRTDGDEGLLAGYSEVTMLAPVRAGDVIETTGTITRIGNRSRTVAFEARVVCRSNPQRGPSAADVIDPPLPVARATGTTVVPGAAP